MSSQPRPFNYMEGPNFQSVELLYQGGDVSMVIFLPREKNGLPDLEKQLTIGNLTGWLEKLEPRSVDVYLPKFLLSSSLDLVELLERLGMKRAFCSKFKRPQTCKEDAEFPEMTVGRGRLLDLFIQGFTQRAWLEVNEEGTEAFVQSASCMEITTGEDVPLPALTTFIADHPFIFLVRHNPSNSLIFLGRLTAPF
jgi:serine protease inhibitor